MSKLSDRKNCRSSTDRMPQSSSLYKEKEFQLLYRQRNKHAKQYDAVLFLKSNCQGKSRSTKPELTLDELRRVVKNLQQQVKQKQKTTPSRNLTKSTKRNQENLQGKSFLERSKSQRSLQGKSSKTERLATKSPKDHKEKYEKHDKTEKHVKPTLMKHLKKSKKAVKLASYEDFLFINDSFISLRKRSEEGEVDMITTLRRGYCSQEVHAKQVAQEEQILNLTRKTDPVTKQHSQKHDMDKIRTIQRWWRSILKKNETLNRSFIVDNNIENHNQELGLNEQQIRENMQGICTKSYPYSPVILPNSLSNTPIQTSTPAATTDSLEKRQGRIDYSPVSDSASHEEYTTLDLRKNAADLELKTQKEILIKLLQRRRISQMEYLNMIHQIETRYEFELIQMDRIRGILKENENKLELMVKKTKENINLAENLSRITDLSELEHLLRLDGHTVSAQTTETQAFCSLGDQQFRVIPKDPARYEREKSSGYHYSSAESSPGQESLSNEEDEVLPPQQDSRRARRLSPEQSDQFYEQGSFRNDHLPDNGPNFKGFITDMKQRQEVRELIDRRIMQQSGGMYNPTTSDDSIDTSIINIHNFLTDFFTFYISNYADEFLRMINMPYGYEPERRLRFMQGYDDDDDDEENQDGVIYGVESIIEDEIFDQFLKARNLEQKEMHGKSVEQTQEDSVRHEESVRQQESVRESQQQCIPFSPLEYESIHFRAIFDSFNEALNLYRPYYQLNGPPYPWSLSEKALTFYFISEDNIKEVFDKSVFRVLKWSASFCGIFVPKYSDLEVREYQNSDELEHLMLKYQKSSHQMVLENREKRLIELEKTEVMENSHEWDLFDEQKTATMYQISSFLLEELIIEAIVEFEEK